MLNFVILVNKSNKKKLTPDYVIRVLGLIYYDSGVVGDPDSLCVGFTFQNHGTILIKILFHTFKHYHKNISKCHLHFHILQ
jgi:hypothetical protein